MLNMGTKMASETIITKDVMFEPSQWSCFGEDDCSTMTLVSCWKDNPVLCQACSIAACASMGIRMDTQRRKQHETHRNI